MPKADDRRNGRRLIRLLSAGWLPHDQGSSRGFLCLANECGSRIGDDCKRDACSNPVCEGSPPLQILSSALDTDISLSPVSPLLVEELQVAVRPPWARPVVRWPR